MNLYVDMMNLPSDTKVELGRVLKDMYPHQFYWRHSLLGLCRAIIIKTANGAVDSIRWTDHPPSQTSTAIHNVLVLEDV